ncbi:MAG TPA: hypothetical protein VMB49_07420 [Acidobacteriaceae bacterium]|nr:hypothetical protein [Acidobacteriaceae bacterium]
MSAAGKSVTAFFSSCRLQILLLAFCFAGSSQAQVPSVPTSPADPASAPDAGKSASSPAAQPNLARQGDTPTLSQREKAEQQLKQEEQQRIVGVVPNFNVSYDQDAVPLSRDQKFRLAFRSATDPVQFGIAGFDAGLSQAENDFPGYGQGVKGYAKRFGASYADNFDGTMLGNGIFPILLRQDPRYFRKGKGAFSTRLFYSLSTTFWCRNDNGNRGPNYSNIIGNLAAGGISNIYYPSTDRGAGLTFERAADVTAYGMLGAVFNEFWPDVAHKVFKNRFEKLQPKDSAPPAVIPPPTTAQR